MGMLSLYPGSTIINYMKENHMFKLYASMHAVYEEKTRPINSCSTTYVK